MKTRIVFVIVSLCLLLSVGSFAEDKKLTDLQLEKVKTQRLEETVVSLQLENAQLLQQLATVRGQLVALAAQTKGAVQRKTLTDELVKALGGDPDKDALNWDVDPPTLIKAK